MLSTRGRTIAVLIAVVLLLAAIIGYIGLQVFDEPLNKKLLSGKVYHSATGTVIKQEIVLFDDSYHSYVSELGDRIEKRPGDKEYRIYFYFDEFADYGEPSQSKLMDREKKRLSENRPHFTIFDDLKRYEEFNLGDKLMISYRAYTNGTFDIVHVEKVRPTH